MAQKSVGTGVSGGSTNTDLISNITSYGAAVTADSQLRTQIWSELVTRDAREKNVFAKFIGGEGSGKPIVEKRDLSAGGSDKVTFTTVAPIRGQGVRGEAVLKNTTGSLNFGNFYVEVDLIRHAVAWTQVLRLMRFTGKTLDQLSAEVMSEWASRMEQDLIQYVLRDSCLNLGSENLISGYGSTASGNLKYGDGLSTDIIQEAKQNLIANGGQPMNTGGDGNQEIPGYLFFAPDACLRPLRSDPDYLEAITQADARSGDNKLYSGSYAKWDNNIIANHNLIIDTAQGRQGSPLAPVTRIPSGSFGAAKVDGWDITADPVNVKASTGWADGDILGGAGTDFWANWPGAQVSVPGAGGSNYSKSSLGNILFVDKDGAYNAFAVDAIGDTITSNAVGDGSGSSYLELGTQITASSSAPGLDGQTANLADGPIMAYPCNSSGTPIGYALAMGEGALYLARGAVSNEQIFHYDDFANSGNQAHLSAVGLQSVYGLAAYQDTSGRVPGVQLVEVVRQVPGLTLGTQT